MYGREPGGYGLTSLVLAAACAVMALFPLSAGAAGASNVIPPQLEKLSTGVATAAVAELLKDAGKFNPEKDDKNRGGKYSWIPPDNPYYDSISFEFTEKDRLYIVRFALKPSAREQSRVLKKTFFDKYDFDPDDPLKIRRNETDILFYSPKQGGKLFFLEFTDTATGSKDFELFDRQVSSEDRPLPVPKPEEKAGDLGIGAMGAPPVPGNEVKPPDGAAPSAAPAPVPPVPAEPKEVSPAKP